MSESEKSDQVQAGNKDGESKEQWAQDLVARVAFAGIIEQRRARRWGILFKFLLLAYLLGLLLLALLPSDWGFKTVIGKGHTAVVSVEGLISSETKASAENVIKGLRAAFEDEQTNGVIVEINSPGGSPVQAGQIYDEIMRLRESHPEIPLYAVASDVCASGGYYIAAAAQEIYADKASLIGSIGVRADSFGFVGAMEKLGIERRLYTAGENKALLDPFTPSNPTAVTHLNTLLSEIHEQFIGAVEKSRGERLSGDPELFSGLFWTGEKSLELGLIDGLASTRQVAEEMIGADKLVDFTPRSRVLDKLFQGVEGAVHNGIKRLLGTVTEVR